MNVEDMKLQESEKSVFASSLSLRKEWYMDPPPWIISRLDERILVDIYKIKMTHLAELVKIEIKIKELESRMFSEIAKTISQVK
jgi:hypothetical protein